jgi:hypothetical protein
MEVINLSDNKENLLIKALADTLIEMNEIKGELKKMLKPEFPEGSGIKSKTVAYRETGEGILVCDTELYIYLLKRAHIYDNISRRGKGYDDVDMHGDQCILFGDDMMGFWFKVHPDYNTETEEIEKVNIEEVLKNDTNSNSSL